MSLRLKLFLPFLLLTLGLAVYITQGWYPSALKFHTRFHHEMLDRQLDSIGEGLASLMLSSRMDEIHGMMGELKRKNPDWQRLELFGEDGKRIYPLAEPETSGGVVLPRHGVGIHEHADAAVLRHEIVIGGRSLGSILLEVNHELMYREIEQSQVRLLEVLAVVLALFVLALGFVVEAIVRRPLGQLAKASAALAGGDFSHALPPVGNDEVGQLIASFAGMRAAVERSQHDLKREITEKKHAWQALKKSEAFLRTLFDTAGEGIWVIDTDKLTVKTNRALLDMLGTNEHDILYKPIYDFADEENAAIFRERSTMTQTQGIGQSYEVALTRTDGRKIHCLFNSAPLYDESGAVMGSFALVFDITERKFVERELRKLSVDLEQRVHEEAAKNREKDHLLIQQSRMAAMGEMIGNIAHQWRQPLNALGLLLANIKDAYQYHELTEAYLNETVAKGGQLVQRMSTTIDDFRNFFKPNREKVVFSLRRAIEDTLSIVDTSLRSHSIAVRMDVERDAMALGFPNEYSQVLLNLIGNAKEVLLERRVAPGWIRLSLAVEGGLVKVTVADNGGGVPEDIMEKIFDPYFTTRARGTGIGLYMSKMIIENNMNGEIRVRNTENGAEFEIIVPMADNESA